MTDIVDAATRSRMMQGIRGTNTLPEHAVRRLLHKLGFRFRIHVRTLPGKPDIVLPRYNAVILVHGCFWHGHDCPLFRLPGTRTQFWENKINANRLNDERIQEKLSSLGWRIGTVWECALRKTTSIGSEKLAKELKKFITGDSRSVNIRGIAPRSKA